MTIVILMLISFVGGQQTIKLYSVPSMAECHRIADAYKGLGQAMCVNAPPLLDGIMGIN